MLFECKYICRYVAHSSTKNAKKNHFPKHNASQLNLTGIRGVMPDPLFTPETLRTRVQHQSPQRRRPWRHHSLAAGGLEGRGKA